MARKKKPALSPEGFGSGMEPDTLEITDDPITRNQPDEKPIPAVEPPKPKAPKANRVGVRLEVFLRISGVRLDQMAGFRRYAINHGMKQMEIKDWHKEYQKFLSLPV